MGQSYLLVTSTEQLNMWKPKHKIKGYNSDWFIISWYQVNEQKSLTNNWHGHDLSCIGKKNMHYLFTHFTLPSSLNSPSSHITAPSTILPASSSFCSDLVLFLWMRAAFPPGPWVIVPQSSCIYTCPCLCPLVDFTSPFYDGWRRGEGHGQKNNMFVCMKWSLVLALEFLDCKSFRCPNKSKWRERWHYF